MSDETPSYVKSQEEIDALRKAKDPILQVEESVEDNHLSTLIEARKLARQEQAEDFSELLRQRAIRENRISELAKSGIEQHKKNTRKAEDNLLINFAVGGMGNMSVGSLEMRQSPSLNTYELRENNTVVALRIYQNALNPVFLLAMRPKGDAAPTVRLSVELGKLMKAFVWIPDTCLDHFLNLSQY